MNIQRGLLLVGALLSAASISPVARADAFWVDSGWGAYRAWPTGSSNASCVSEQWGAAYNGCSGAVPMMFVQTADTLANTGTINSPFIMYAYGTVTQPFTCVAQSIQPEGGNYGVWGAPFSFTGGSGTTGNVVRSNLNVPVNYSFRVYCASVPAGAGIASIAWGS
jgi:hypothetical protein